MGLLAMVDAGIVRPFVMALYAPMYVFIQLKFVVLAVYLNGPMDTANDMMHTAFDGVNLWINITQSA